MKKNILIVLAVILAAALIGELAYVAYRKAADKNHQPGESTTDSSAQSTLEPGAVQTTTENTEAGTTPEVPVETEDEGTEPAETAKPSNPGKPAETTKPAEPTKPAGTEPEETTTESVGNGFGENDLPEIPI